MLKRRTGLITFVFITFQFVPGIPQPEPSTPLCAKVLRVFLVGKGGGGKKCQSTLNVDIPRKTTAKKMCSIKFCSRRHCCQNIRLKFSAVLMNTIIITTIIMVLVDVVVLVCLLFSSCEVFGIICYASPKHHSLPPPPALPSQYSRLPMTSAWYMWCFIFVFFSNINTWTEKFRFLKKEIPVFEIFITLVQGNAYLPFLKH